MQGLITKVVKTYKLFKLPNAIGDLIEQNGIKYLITLIQRFYYDSVNKVLVVNYIVQRMDKSYSTNKPTLKPIDTYPAYFHYTLKTLNQNEFNREVKPLQMNDIAYFERINATARVVDITGLKFNGTDLVVNVLVQPINPISPEQAKRIRIQESGLKLIKLE